LNPESACLALRRSLAGEGAGTARDDLIVRYIYEVDSMCVIVARGEAKAEIEAHLLRVTGRQASGPIGVWVLDEQEIAAIRELLAAE